MLFCVTHNATYLPDDSSANKIKPLLHLYLKKEESNTAAL